MFGNCRRLPIQSPPSSQPEEDWVIQDTADQGQQEDLPHDTCTAPTGFEYGWLSLLCACASGCGCWRLHYVTRYDGLQRYPEKCIGWLLASCPFDEKTDSHHLCKASITSYKQKKQCVPVRIRIAKQAESALAKWKGCTIKMKVAFDKRRPRWHAST
mmetsp:Transcript_15904/g.36541  ORF Transcript_15904/g.36541 Transcript_15904/m.36541 type:complete len:157 (+) Transcript_15904:817-1287(+)